MSEVHLQRKELERLLQTAKDKDRQELLKNAIASLDEASTETVSAVHPALRTSFREETIATSSLEVAPHNIVVQQSSGLMRGMRPLSAQPRRRMSFGQLAAIPENRSLLTRNVERHQQQRQNRSSQGVSPTSGKNNSSPLHKPQRNGGLRRSFDLLGEEVTVRADDVRYAVASSFDARKPPIGLFHRHSSSGTGGVGVGGFMSKSNSASSFNLCDSSIDENSDALTYISPSLAALATSGKLTGGGGNNPHKTTNATHSTRSWMSTGLMPQFLYVKFHERWLITQITIRCSGVESLEVVVTNDEYYEHDYDHSSRHKGGGNDSNDNSDSESINNVDFNDYSRGFGGMGGYGSVSSSSGSGHGTFSPPYRGGSTHAYSSHHHTYSSGHGSATTIPSASSHNSLLLRGTPQATPGCKSTTFVCDIDAVCKAKGDHSPQQHMIIKRPSLGLGGLGHDKPSEGKSRGNSPEPPAITADAASAKYGIIGTQLQVHFLNASASFIHVWSFDIKATSY